MGGLPGIGVGAGGQFGVSASGGPIRSQDTSSISFSTGAFGAPAQATTSYVMIGAMALMVMVILWLAFRSKA